MSAERKRVSRADAIKAEQELIAEIGRRAYDPLAFVNFSYPWGQPGTPLASWPGPKKWQAETLDVIGSRLREQLRAKNLQPIRIARASGRGPGKSCLVAWITDWAMSTMTDTRVLITANTDPQLRTKTWPEVMKWHNLLICRHWFNTTATRIASVDPKHADTWRADALPWSAENIEAFAGLHNAKRRIVMIFDEAAGIDDLVWETAEGVLTDKDTEIIWLVFGNMTKTTGRLVDCFEREAAWWDHRTIDIREVEGTNLEEVKRWVDVRGEDDDWVRIHVRGIPPKSSVSQFIPADLVKEAASRQVYTDRTAPLVMGVDVARGGHAQSVIRFRRGRDARSIPPVKLRTDDTMVFASAVVQQASLHRVDAIFIDGGGVGGGVIDRVRQMTRIAVTEVQFGKKADRAAVFEVGANQNVYANKRAEMWGNMRDWLATGSIDGDPELFSDLVGIEYGYVLREGRDAIQLSPKEMSGRTCDDADALATTFAYPVVASGLAESGKSGHLSSYDPYARFWSQEMR